MAVGRTTKQEIGMDNVRRALGVDAIESSRRKMYEDRNVVVEVSDNPEPEIPLPRYTKRGYTAPVGKKLYEATSTNGIISVRASAIEMKFATCVSDPNGTTTRRRQGMIRSLFPSRIEAEQQALALSDRGLRVVVVPARPYAGQDGDRAAHPADLPGRQQ